MPPTKRNLVSKKGWEVSVKDRCLSSAPPMLSSSGVASPVESSPPTTARLEGSPVVVALELDQPGPSGFSTEGRATVALPSVVTVSRGEGERERVELIMTSILQFRCKSALHTISSF